MPWAFGPILTAGVALGAATVVVANPVVVPRADMQIPVADLPVTVTGDGRHNAAVDMLDEDFIRAVGPGPTASANPLAVLTDLVRVLVADAADLGRTAILHAFATGARVIADPALTSTSYPYIPAVPSDPAALPWPGPTGPATDTGNLGPVVAQALTAILTEVGEVSHARAIVAAFAAGAALASEQVPVFGVVESVGDDLRGVLRDTASVVVALPRPRELIGDGIRAVIKVLPPIEPVPIAGPHTEAPPSDADTPITDAPDPSSSVDDSRTASPLADRRARPIDDPLNVATATADTDDDTSVADPAAAPRASNLRDALGLGQRTQRESGEAASPAGKHRAGRAAR